MRICRCAAKTFGKKRQKFRKKLFLIVFQLCATRIINFISSQYFKDVIFNNLVSLLQPVEQATQDHESKNGL